MMHAETSWQSGGVTVTVTSDQTQGQTDGAFLDAHKLAVRDARVTYPPD